MILDASAGVTLFVKESASVKVATLVEPGGIHVPTLFYSEVANALWKKVRRGEADPARFALRFGSLELMLLAIDERPFAARALAIALELDHPAYDCVYLAIAEALGDRVVTLDRRFCNRVTGTRYAAHLCHVDDA